MNAGRRTSLITFEARVLTTQSTGSIDTTWSPLASDGGFTEWAEAIPIGATSARFSISYRNGITSASHRIVWRNAIWNIESAEFDAKNIDLIINSTFARMIEVTHLQSTENEFIDGLPTLNPTDL